MRAVRLGVKFIILLISCLSVFVSAEVPAEKNILPQNYCFFLVPLTPPPNFNLSQHTFPSFRSCQDLTQRYSSNFPISYHSNKSQFLALCRHFLYSLTEAPLFSYRAVLYNRSQLSNHLQYPKCITSYHYDTSFTQPKIKNKNI